MHRGYGREDRVVLLMEEGGGRWEGGGGAEWPKGVDGWIKVGSGEWGAEATGDCADGGREGVVGWFGEAVGDIGRAEVTRQLGRAQCIARCELFNLLWVSQTPTSFINRAWGKLRSNAGSESCLPF